MHQSYDPGSWFCEESLLKREPCSENRRESCRKCWTRVKALEAEVAALKARLTDYHAVVTEFYLTDMEMSKSDL